MSVDRREGFSPIRRFLSARSTPISRCYTHMIWVAAIILFALIAPGCSPAARQRVGNAANAAAVGAAQGSVANPKKLMIFGGQDHGTYLGCLNCSNYASDSVLNQYGEHGSQYSSLSIWNHYNQFGSAYSNFGACNAYATDPPVIVDSEGNFYGRLTMNQYHLQIGIGKSYYEWLENSVCRD